MVTSITILLAGQSIGQRYTGLREGDPISLGDNFNVYINFHKYTTFEFFKPLKKQFYKKEKFG